MSKYRVGRHVGMTLYKGDTFIGSVVNELVAAELVEDANVSTTDSVSELATLRNLLRDANKARFDANRAWRKTDEELVRLRAALMNIKSRCAGLPASLANEALEGKKL